MADAAGAGSRTRERAQNAVLALHARHLAWVRTSGMSGLLVLLAFGMFVIPALVSEEEKWRLATDLMLTFILLSGVAAVVEHRRIAIALIVLSAIVVAV